MVRNEQHREVKCPKCEGAGTIILTETEFIQKLKEDFLGQYNIVSEALWQYRLWKYSKKVYCPECDGVGTWVVDK